MDQDTGREEPVDPAAVAFEALRREVALLNVALAGLAAERASAPDYSETLGEIAQGVRVAVGRIGKLAASPARAANSGGAFGGTTLDWAGRRSCQRSQAARRARWPAGRPGQSSRRRSPPAWDRRPFARVVADDPNATWATAMA